MPTMTVREYHPESGALLNNISVLKWGKVSSGTTSRVKVIDIAFDGATNIGNVKIGLIANAGITVNADPQNRQTDGSTLNGNFGVESTSTFDSSKASEPLSRHFGGLNGTALSTNENNVSVGMRNTGITNYIYLDVEIGASLSGTGNGAYKIFFDYS